MEGEVIKSFLVGLGFGVDDASLAKFNKAIQSASLRVTALYASIKVAAAGIFWSISKISEGFEQMGYEYRIIAPMINKTLVLRRELLNAYRAAGIDITKTIRASVMFNMSLTKTKFALEAIYKSVGAKFFPLLTKQMDAFRLKIYANMPRIQDSLERVVKFVFKAFQAITILGTRLWSILGRVYDFFKKLDDVTSGWSTTVLAMVAAWKFLNLAFLATPLGMLIAGLTTLLALWDDFQTFKEGGQSLIDWSGGMARTLGILLAVIAAIPPALAIARGAMIAFNGAVAAGQMIMRAFSAIMAAYRYIQIAVNVAMYANPVGVVIGAFVALAAAIAAVIVYWDELKGLVAGGWNALSSGISSTFGAGGTAGMNFQQLKSDSPIMPSSTRNSSNQTIKQETNINVQGTADPNGTASAVAGQQSSVNRDMTRNMKGAIKQ